MEKRSKSAFRPAMYILLTALLVVLSCNDDCRLPENCNLVPDEGPCNAYILRYYYDHAEKKCKQFVWGGCNGTVPFVTLEDCEKECDCK